ncbi:hypothetical protein CIK05_12890 [Bdellovibrio sp. qaytius]|nr:hypothetical protein CIK05_12890 [Bdellovibrio sp. qaytius]
MPTVDTENKNFLFDEAVTKAITSAVRETFYEMCRLPTDFESALIANRWEPVGSGSGRISLESEQQKGVLQLHFSESAILALMAKLLGRAPMQINSESLDCVGALTGIIYGRMKAILNPTGYKFIMAIPEMYLTAKLAVPEGDVRHLVIPFRIANSRCYIQITSGIL